MDLEPEAHVDVNDHSKMGRQFDFLKQLMPPRGLMA